MKDILIQLISLLAWFFITISYWQNKKITLVIFQIIANLTYAIHFYLLGGISGTLCNLAGVVVLFLLLIKEKSKKNCYGLIIPIILIFMFIFITSYNKPYDIFPIFACIIPLGTNWFKNTLIIRIGGIIGTISWIIYDIFVGSYIGIITNIIFVFSTALSIYKNNTLNNKS